MLALLTGLLLPTALPSDAKAIEARVQSILRQLTPDEKLSLIAGVEGFNLAPVPRLGLPKLLMSDGPAGVRNFGPTTAYPAPVGLAATFNSGLAKRFGEAIGRDARARGVHIWLAPGVNLARIPQNGRNFEYLGEDPLLAGRLAGQIIGGVQSQGVVATIKHFAANEHEDDRNNDSSEVDETTLRELYLRPFEIAIKEGKPWAVMCSYNRLNGTHTSEHEWLLNTVLKKQWGFLGIVMSDWGAVHSALGPALHGMDLEMPGPDFMNPRNLKPMLADGRLPMAKLDDKVRRILRMEVAMNFIGGTQKRPEIPLDNPETGEVALEIARQGTVLLRNKGGVLPLDAKAIKRILVVGPNAARPATGGGGSSYTQPFRAIGLGEAIQGVVGPNVEVRTIATEVGIPQAALRMNGLVQGAWRAQYWNNPRFRDEPVFEFEEPRIDHDWSGKPPVPGMSKVGYSVRWSGSVVAPTAGAYSIYARSDDGMRVMIDGRKIIDNWRDQGVQTTQGRIQLSTGQRATIVVEYYQNGGDAIAQFGMRSEAAAAEDLLPTDELTKADVVIAATGFGPNLEGEGFDRPFALPSTQQLLLRRLAKHPRVIVVNNSGAGVDMSEWVDSVAGIIQAWYPGQNGNQAVAEILFGKVNPSGKLPTTFPSKLAGTYYASAFPPEHPKMVYREGGKMGYRWFAANPAVKPLFPFGFGLSYTTFKLSPVSWPKTVGDVQVRVTNTGMRAGTETVQLYVDGPIGLVSFQRIALQPGESKVVSLPLRRQDFARWDLRTSQWKVEGGKKVGVRVGTSSASPSIQFVMSVPR